MWDLLWKLKRYVRLLGCLAVGHDVIGTMSRWNCEPDWCERCWFNEEELDIHDGVTLPRLLNWAYCWLVERDWTWFERLDLWLCTKSGWLPFWWEY